MRSKLTPLGAISCDGRLLMYAFGQNVWQIPLGRIAVIGAVFVDTGLTCYDGAMLAVVSDDESVETAYYEAAGMDDALNYLDRVLGGIPGRAEWRLGADILWPTELRGHRMVRFERTPWEGPLGSFLFRFLRLGKRECLLTDEVKAQCRQHRQQREAQDQR